MTIQTVITTVAERVLGFVPDTVFGSSDLTVRELVNLAQDCAKEIAQSHDWRDLTKIATFNGDGTTSAFPKPIGYDRMVQASWMRDNQSLFWGYFAIESVNEWMDRSDTSWISPGGWIYLGGEFQFHPAPSGDTSFPYISNRIVRDESGVMKERFTSNEDEFVLCERLLELCLMWRYRAQKGLDYGEDMATYEVALSQRQTKDGGSKVIRQHGSNSFLGRVAWPWELG